MRKIFFALLLVFLLSGISACGNKTPSPQKEAELEEDLINATPFFQTGVDISSFEIIKRQTNENMLSDTVYVEVRGQGPYYEYITSYIMYYSLYDQGWLLDDVIRWYEGNWGGAPFAGVPEDIVQDILGRSPVPRSSFYYENQYWSSRLIEITNQIYDIDSGTSTVFYKYAIESTDKNYGYYLVDDVALFEFDSETFCYYLSPVDISDHSNVSLILSDNIIGEAFSYERFGEEFTVSVEPAADNNHVNVYGSHNNLEIDGKEYRESIFSCMDQEIITFRKETSGGYVYHSNVHLGDIVTWSNLAENNVWFSIGPKGVDFIDWP